jgi:hypothetical protein
LQYHDKTLIAAARYICFTEEGDEYYYNPDTDDTRWEVPEGVHRALMNLWDAPENPNDMAIDDDEAPQAVESYALAIARRLSHLCDLQCSEQPAPALSELSRPISEVVFTAVAVTRCQAIVRYSFINIPTLDALLIRCCDIYVVAGWCDDQRTVLW